MSSLIGGLRCLVLAALCALSTLLGTATGAAAQNTAAAPRPTLKLQIGHQGKIDYLAIRADSRIAATAGEDNSVRLWDIASGREARTLTRVTENEGLYGLAFGGGPTMPLAIQHKRSISLWNTTNGTLLRNIPVEMGFSMVSGWAPRRMAVSPDGRYLVTLSGSWLEETVKLNLWDLTTGKSLVAIPAGKQQWLAPAFRPDSKRVAIATDDGFLVLEVPSGKVARRVTLETDVGHMQGAVKDLAYTRDGQSVVVQRSINNELSLYDPHNGGRTKILTLPSALMGEAAFSMALRPGTDLLAVTNAGGGMTVWDLPSGAPVAVVPNVNSDFLAFTPDGSGLLSLGEKVRVWDAATYRPLRELRGGTAPMRTFALAPDARSFYFSSDAGGVYRWDLTTGGTAPFAPGAIAPTALAAGKRALLVGEADGKVTLYDRDRGTALRALGKPLGQIINCAALSPTGDLAAVGTNPLGSIKKAMKNAWDDADSRDGSSGKKPNDKKPRGKTDSAPPAPKKGEEGICAVYDVATGSVRFRFPYPDHAVGAVAFSPDGKRLAVGAGTLDIYDLTTGKKVRSFQPEPEGAETTLQLSSDVFALAFDRTGNRLLLRLLSGVQVWDLATETRKESFPIALADTSAAVGMGALLAGLSVFDIALSPDGSLFAANEGSTVVVYDTAAHRPRYRLPGHEGDILRLAFHPDGSLLYTAGTDGTVRLWDMKTGQPRLLLAQAEGGEGVLATPTGEYLATRGGLRAIAFRVGDRAYPFEQFDLRFNRPEAVLARLPLGDQDLIETYRQSTARRLALNGVLVTPVAATAPLPSLTIHPPPVSVAAPELPLQVSAQGSGLTALLVTINGVPVRADANTGDPSGEASLHSGLPLSGDTWQGNIRLTLTPGLNRVAVRVRDASGQESLRQTYLVTCDAPAPPPDLYLVAVGVSAYQEGRWNLDFARKDAEDVAALFQTSRRFGRVRTLLLTDEKATRDAVEEQANRFLAEARPGDTVIAFFAGHGLRRGGEFYFATHDMAFQDPARNGLSFARIESLLSRCAARQKALLIDACQAGEIDPLADTTATAEGNTGARGLRVKSFRGVAGEDMPQGEASGSRAFVLMQQFFADVREQGIVVIAASGGAEYALERDGNGVFTAALKEALSGRKAFDPATGGATMGSLRRYVSDQVRARTGGRQTPMARGEPLENDWTVYGDALPTPAVAGAKISLPAGWQRIVTGPGFTVAFPPGRVESSDKTAEVGPNATLRATVWELHTTEGYYSLLDERFDDPTWAKYLASLPPGASETDRFLNDSIRLFSANEGSTIKKITEISLGELRGREYEFEGIGPKGGYASILVRVYVGRGRRLVLTAAKPSTDGDRVANDLRIVRAFVSSLEAASP